MSIPYRPRAIFAMYVFAAVTSAALCFAAVSSAGEVCVGPEVVCYVKKLHSDRGLSYPPKGMTLAAFKEEGRVELWAETGDGPVHLKTYEVCAASGEPGPKLRQGDRQVPEGVYKVVYLNPNSRFHLSLLIDYPNRFDREMAKTDGRGNLGSSICIHGGCASIGCIALGDDAIEEIFQLASDVGAANCRVIIAPYDFRAAGRPEPERLDGPKWVGRLYDELDRELSLYAAAR